MRSAAIALLVLCEAASIPGPAFAQAGHAAEQPIATLPPGTNPQVEQLLQNGHKALAASQIDQADGFYRAAVATAEKIKDPQQQAELPRALDWQAAFFRQTKRYPEAWQAAARSLKLFNERFGPADPRADHMRV